MSEYILTLEEYDFMLDEGWATKIKDFVSNKKDAVDILKKNYMVYIKQRNRVPGAPKGTDSDYKKAYEAGLKVNFEAKKLADELYVKICDYFMKRAYFSIQSTARSITA